MNRQIAYFTLEQIIKIQPMTELQAVLTFIDYSILQENAVECFFGEGKENYALNNLRVTGLNKAV
ncbi:hypothetical protein SAMN05446037_101730 [Anaerovirgula multivorans]|uniref:Uncharacterized protein n=1 Tax=Anaerovirgula multivorans TaxID=312168 RepID=A0A239GIB2_9FIRM|nr:hypothetical protein [Anaerovirgula multivorans]SNS68927.1 hypothetical protein SAMN05446037_101730 [Anaerovirgula multivorans]